MEKYRGLSRDEVENSAKLHGTNRITEKEKPSLWKKYWMNFNDPIITILLIALGINVLFTFLGKVDWYECAGILAAVIIATFVSTVSEFKNENTFRKLQEKASKILCKVYRDGELREVMIDEIVAGDIILLQSGDLIPADGAVISGKIKVDQSALNGESKEVEKKANKDGKRAKPRLIDFWDEQSVYRGSVVCSGQCVIRADSVGDDTLYGRLTIEAQENERKSPLNIKLSRLAKDISYFGYIGAFLVFLMFMFQRGFANNSFDSVLIGRYFSDAAQVISDVIEAVIMAVTVIVVAVPEGLPLMIAIVCSLNMRKMLKNNVLVRKIVGIETAGSVNILFTDKTGTLTKGKLCVTDFIDGGSKCYESFGKIPPGLKKLLHISISGNTGAVISNGRIIGGNGTEKALMQYIMNSPMDSKISKIDELPFSSDKKYSMTCVSGDFCGTLIKGAPEKILGKCTGYYDAGGDVQKLETTEYIEKIIQQYAKRASRIIALAVSDEAMGEELPDGMILVGLIAIKDSVRENVKNAVEEVMRAGIQVVMITGDRKETAVAIAKECGIVTSERDLILTSDELHMMGDTELRNKLGSIRVVARALPEDKSRLVRVAQSCNLVVGMTGDGVNDSPALKSADVGFAMGSGTEVAKEAGDIVIMDDNFSSIKKAVLYGRTIYNSIKKFITFQLTINVAAVSVSVIGLFAGIEKPLNITQMLWINLVMDTLAAIAFGGEPALKRYMLEKPKRRDESILDKRMWSAVLTDGFFICIISMIIFMSDGIHNLFRCDASDVCFYTGYFSFFVFTSIFNAFNARADGIDLLENLSENRQFIIVMAAVAIIQILMTYFGGRFLRTVGLNYKEWLTVIALAFLIVPLDIIRKIITK